MFRCFGCKKKFFKMQSYLNTIIAVMHNILCTASDKMELFWRLTYISYYMLETWIENAYNICTKLLAVHTINCTIKYLYL